MFRNILNLGDKPSCGIDRLADGSAQAATPRQAVTATTTAIVYTRICMLPYGN
jgi:uncharacterized protein YbbK (DUF523 family)